MIPVKFLADECCDIALVRTLRADGHDVLYVIETMRGASGQAILDCAFLEQRIILTEDKDFGELVYRLRKPACGIILLRFLASEGNLKASRLQNVLQKFSDRLAASFVVLDSKKVRIRPLR